MRAGRLVVESAVVTYGGIEAVHSISLTLQAASTACVIGPNGAGKTSLLSAMAGLVPGRFGRLELDGQDLSKLSAARRARAGIALVPEGRHVFKDMTVDENLTVAGYGRAGKGVVAAAKEAVYGVFAPLASRKNQVAGHLSGGEQQMLAIGRAMMLDPKVILLDEPSMGLAPQVMDDVYAVLAQFAQAGVSLLIVEQNAELVLSVASHGYVMINGVISLSGSANDLRNSEVVHSGYMTHPGSVQS